MASELLVKILVFDVIAWFWFQFSIFTIILVNLIASIYVNRHFLKLAVETFPRDFKGLLVLISHERAIKRHLKSGSTVGSIFEENVRNHPNKIAFVNLETGRKWTFAEFNDFTNQIANYFDSQGYKKGDVVALLGNNSPEYVAYWLGLSKIGVVTALINYNLRGEPLGHSIRTAASKCLILGAEFETIVEEDQKNGYVDSNLKLFVFGGQISPNLKAENLSEHLTSASKLRPTNKNVDFKSVLIYIYTSGTTGLPKAAIITHARFYMMTMGINKSFGIENCDKLYVIMPLYHSAAGMLGVGQTLLAGCTAVIRKKFSSSRFWDDCVEHECTVSQYIGEICRYLLAQPYKPSEKQHQIRLMFGVGLRQQIWLDFVNRFGVKKIGEHYGSTEGNASLLNLDNTVGACGFLPIYPFTSDLYPIRLVKVDEHTGELIRDKDGLCVKCKPGDYGEMVGKIIKDNPVKEFLGYVSEKDTNKKLIRDVFRKGDVAFSSGDVLYMNEKGYVFFKDRTGDTFRWKGENVSTTEVEGVIQKVLGMTDATAYGVEIPGTEGKAGMTAIVDENQNVDLRELNKKIKESLPSYARPIFLRFCKQVETTGTYKLKKNNLQKAGYDPDKCGDDKLFYLDPKTGEYEQLTSDKLQEIVGGKMKF